MDMGNIMKQAQEMQQKMVQIQEELARKQITGEAGGGMVKVMANGRGEILSVNIEQEMVNADELEMLQDLITAAANDALTKAKELGSKEMGHLTGGLKIPGLSNIF
ncbi:MAG: YbaB/EbfC family nucleoid-associated protein [Deltaproteobacteria bacterium]|nr:MAG: YbaB/EbfC family nucleoid-associated protein [Deltaproteobacteria bacterium]